MYSIFARALRFWVNLRRAQILAKNVGNKRNLAIARNGIFKKMNASKKIDFTMAPIGKVEKAYLSI